MTRSLMKDQFDSIVQGQDVFTFPMVLRSQNFPPIVVETAFFESCLTQLVEMKSLEIKKREFLRGNPSNMTMVFNSPVKALEGDLGMFLFWIWRGEIKATKVNPQLALILDCLSDGDLKELHQHQLKDPEFFQSLRNEGIIV